ncbi:MAG: AAA family ATPase, partial [Nitrososphaerales archaeon]|nr:AAA family ATPase [Nitrososphaerales archaeon]
MSNHKIPKIIYENMLHEVTKVVVGKTDIIKMLTVALFSEGHVLLEGVPGVAKTLLAKAFAKSLGLSFRRIQFTPDMLPSDIVGTFVFNQKIQDFVFREGPIFANVILADEINRTAPKTQSALLEVMQERQVTVEGFTKKVNSPFIVIATQNPVEHEGTYPLPEAQLDRFMFRLIIDYPTHEESVK